MPFKQYRNSATVRKLYDTVTGHLSSRNVWLAYDDALKAASRHRVRLQFSRVLIASNLLPSDMENYVLKDFEQRSRWQKSVRNFAEYFFEALSKEGISAVLIKGFGIQDLYPDELHRDIWDLDCAVTDFDSFLVFAKVLCDLGGKIEGLAVRKGEKALTGTAEIRLPAVGDLYKSIKVECQIGGQPLSRFKMRPYDETFWKSSYPISTDSAIRIPPPSFALEILAGEVTENKGRIRLRDYIDYQVLMSNLSERSDFKEIGNNTGVRVLVRRITSFALKHGLPRPSIATHLHRKTLRNKPPYDFKLCIKRLLYLTARAIVLRTKSDLTAGFLAKLYPLQSLWSLGCYVDAIPVNMHRDKDLVTEIDDDRRLLKTAIGDFLFVPFGLLTSSDLNNLRATI